MAKSEEIIFFTKKKVEVVLAVDKTFLRFHECGGSGEVLLPKGIKWVSPTSISNEKEG